MDSRLWLVVVFWSTTFAMDNLNVVYEWKQLDFEYEDASAREEAIRTREFIPENNLPLGLEVHRDRVFITVPRWKSGVAASLTYIKRADPPSDSPKLHPYPNWEAHKIRANETPEIISPFRLRADRCDRLWVLDSGVADLLGDTKELAPPRLLIYDLSNDNLLRKYVVPQNQRKHSSFFANIAVEDHDCADTYAYLGDLGGPGLVVYSWRTGESWRVDHHYFHVDPLAGHFVVDEQRFSWEDGVFGLALSKPDQEGYSTLYFHPMSSTSEFSVSTKVLRDPNYTLANYYHNFTYLGSRGPKAQSSVSFLDTKTDVLFYALVNLNAIACWRTTNPNYTMQSQGRVFMSNRTMIMPNDIKVDAEGNLWALSDRLPKFMYDKLDPNEVNFRIFMAPVADAIRETACDSKLVAKVKQSERNKEKNRQSSVDAIHVTSLLVAILCVAIRIF